MVGTELLEAGQLTGAIERAAAEVKAKPGDPAARTFYFELLCLNGDLDRAAKQLDVLASATGELGSGVNIYLGAIQAEKERRRFFHRGPRPHVVGAPPYANAYLEAVEHYAAGNLSAAANLLEKAAEDERSLRGTLNGAEIHELSDSNDLLAPFLEVIMDGHYSWVPWEAIQSLSVPEPRYLRDLVWAPASMTLHSGDRGEVLVYSLYVDSHLQEDDVKLGRRTIWSADRTEFTIAYGQKVITSGDTDCPILEIRALEVEL
ncbi:MAG: tetratricopeptide repeat protein [Acidobacteriia bacterium]|nr:tetratricopeptide repeat protein [Terriglobia bacterium]